MHFQDEFILNIQDKTKQNHKREINKDIIRI